MNDFTKTELQEIMDAFEWIEGEKSLDVVTPLRIKIQSMIDNFDAKDTAKSHLREAFSLISHAKCLLGLDDE